MVIVLFLIDTSASMNQRTNLGTTYLDIAKSSLDAFSKVTYAMFRLSVYSMV